MKFWYLREFSKESKLANITVIERLILSALLTAKINDDDRDLVEIIMNFDGALDYSNYQEWNFYKEFAGYISKYMKEAKGHIGDWIVNNYGNKNIVHRVPIEYSDLEMSYKNTISKVACKAFILGAANHSVNDNNDWFSFNLFHWNKTARLQKKRTIDEINDYAGRHGIFIDIIGNKVTVLNKKSQISKKIEEQENKPEVQKVKKEMNDYVESLKAVKEEPEETDPVMDLTYKPSFEIPSPFDLGDDRLSKDIVKQYIENDSDKISNSRTINNPIIMTFSNTQIYKEYLSKLLRGVNFDKDLVTVYEGGFLQGNDWQNRKNIAEAKIQQIQKKTLSALNKLYDGDKDTYSTILNYICRTFPKLFYF